MAFGLGNLTARMRTSGFRTSGSNSGWNLGRGANNRLLNFLNVEIPYTQVFSGMVRSGQVLSTFDFNQSDEELRRLSDQYNQNMAAALGNLAGRGIGSALTVGLGGVAGLSVPKISSGKLAREITKATTQKAREDIVGEVRTVLFTTGQLVANKTLIEGYIKLRTLLKNQPLPLLRTLFGDDTAFFIKNSWGEPDAPRLVLYEALEEKIEQIPNQLVRTFIENAVEEFGDTIIENGYIIASELDSALRNFQLQNSQTERVITLQTNADEPDSESFVISGDNYEVSEQEIRTTLNNWRAINNRDIGRIIAYDSEIIETLPIYRRIQIIYRSSPVPPFVNPDGTPAKKAVVTIPNLKKGITWNQIKRGVKYSKARPAYIWGDSVAVLKFVDKRKIRLQYSNTNTTRTAIEQYLRELSDLSTGIIRTITANDYLEQPRANRDLAINMYPTEAIMTLIDPTNPTYADQNTLDRATFKFPLWVDNEPQAFKDAQNQRFI